MCVLDCISNFYFLCWELIGIEGNLFCSFSSIINSEKRLLNLEGVRDKKFEDELAIIRKDYSTAKERFLKIPDALHGMQKMDPRGNCVPTSEIMSQ